MSRAVSEAPPGPRPPRLHLVVALGLGLALVALPLYMWRRPRAVAVDDRSDAAQVALAGDAGAGATLAVGPGAAAPPPSPAVTVSDVRVLSCHDPGPRRTPPEQCDALAPVAQALQKAVAEAATCVPPGAGGSLQFVADVSFARRRLPYVVFAPRDGRSGKNVARSANACAAAVKRALVAAAPVDLGAVPHLHARYKLTVTASYPGAPSAAAPGTIVYPPTPAH